MQPLDVIGDVHGHASRLRDLLEALGYAKAKGAWRHPERQAVFVGDLIDRGPDQLETLRMVRAMTDAGSARVVLGNHEFNAVAYATVDPVRPDYCRPHNDKNDSQHRAFLAEVGFDTPIHRELVRWFMEIPLWLDFGELRVIHACWSRPHVDALAEILGPGRTLTQQTVIEGTTKGTGTHKAIEVLLKGPEIDLGGLWYLDKEAHRRDRARLQWWRPQARTLRDAVLIPPDTILFDAEGAAVPELPDRPLGDDEFAPYDGPVPVLFGHYWWRRAEPWAMTTTAACLDFSVARYGDLAAYRWDGEQSLKADKFVFS